MGEEAGVGFWWSVIGVGVEEGGESVEGRGAGCAGLGVGC